jgi:hypothetical protein
MKFGMKTRKCYLPHLDSLHVSVFNNIRVVPCKILGGINTRIIRCSVLVLCSYFIFYKHEATTKVYYVVCIYYTGRQVQILIGTSITIIIVVAIITMSLLRMSEDLQGWMHPTVVCSYIVPCKSVQWIKSSLEERIYIYTLARAHARTHTHTHTHTPSLSLMIRPIPEAWFSL